MAKKPRKTDEGGVLDYRYDAKRKNIPPAGLAARGKILAEAKVRYSYNPHLAPTLRFDATGKEDGLPELLTEALQRPLSVGEANLLADATRNHAPWLEWAGKREQQDFVADPIALHIHERVSAQAILKMAARQDIPRSLFADPEQEYREAVQFYQHDVDWANRLILGDSLAVMASLARREGLAGKVQMIYVDPPYGIRYASNFQPEIGKRDVKDRPEDLTREPEMVKAYRDTWTLGVHSYLSYLRDRFTLCKELLADTGSVFVQIGDENLHRVRNLMDEVFGTENFFRVVSFKKTGGFDTQGLSSVADFLLWYTRDFKKAKLKTIFTDKDLGEGSGERYKSVLLPDGQVVPLGFFGNEIEIQVPKGAKPFLGAPLTSDGAPSETRSFVFQERKETPKANQHWKTTADGLERLARSERIFQTRDFVNYRLFLQDFGAAPITNLWTDTMGTAEKDKAYVVQTPAKVVERCLLMTTDTGDLVLDPTCGGGTTAYVAEQWGRRWITVDVSRVAVAIARQRLLTAKYDFYRLRPTSAEDVRRNPVGPWLTDPTGEIPGSCTFDCKTVPHVTLKSIAQNQALDPIFDKWDPILAGKVVALNSALGASGTPEVRKRLLGKLQARTKAEGKNAVTDADERRWKLPVREWKEWEVPFDTDPDWPKPLAEALSDHRKAWSAKMDEVNACIAARANQEELVDRPFVDRSILRVSGPFTVEGVIPAEDAIDTEGHESPIGGAPGEMETFASDADASNAEAYVDKMIRLLRQDGVRFLDNKILKFSRLEKASGSTLHAEGAWSGNGGGETRSVAVVLGPQYGPVTAKMVEDCIPIAAKRGHDDLVFAGFSFDGTAQAAIQDDSHPRVRIHMAQIRPDVNMGDLLKTTSSSQIFTVSGTPRTELVPLSDAEFKVRMEGVDIYDPVTNSVRSAGADKVAAWFVDADYDGRTFCITQAFFPDRKAWAKLSKALSGAIDPERFEAFSGTESLPFPAGKHGRVAVKVIDPRGSEVMRVHRLPGSYD
jgi:adenine-specific DNA-methyltransferase